MFLRAWINTVLILPQPVTAADLDDDLLPVLSDLDPAQHIADQLGGGASARTVRGILRGVRGSLLSIESLIALINEIRQAEAELFADDKGDDRATIEW
jgi:hypothetical protein